MVSLFLQHIVKEVAQELSCEIHNVALATPNTFGQRQRQALIHATKIAQIQNVRIVSSCLATAVYSRFSHKHTGPVPLDPNEAIQLPHKKMLIVDVSHMACSLAIIEAKMNRAYTDIVRVHSTGGSDLGGIGTILNEFSSLMVIRFVEQYQQYHENILYLPNPFHNNTNNNYVNEYKNNIDGFVNYDNQGQQDYSTHHDLPLTDTIAPPTTIKTHMQTPYNGHYKKENKTTSVSNGKHGNPNKSNNNSKKQRKQLSMADRMLSQYSTLATLELSDDHTDKQSPISNGHFHNGGESPHHKNGEISKTKSTQSTEEPLITHWRRQSLLHGHKDVWNNEDETEHKKINEAKQWNNKTLEETKQEEATKCRFRARMICANVLEHLHDKYQKDISLHYDRFYGDYSLHMIMQLQNLQQLIIEPVIFEIRQQIDLLLQNTNEIDVADTHSCIVTGDGMTIPSVLDCIEDYFEIDQNFKNKPIVSRGCALVCATDQELTSQPLSFEKLPMPIKLLDPLTEDKLLIMLPKQSLCPCKKTQLMTTWMDDQTEIRLKFYEGEGLKAQQANLIGEYAIRGISPRQAGETRIVLILNVDRNCLLVVNAEDVTDPESPTSLVIIRGT